MGFPVVHFEIIGTDPDKLRAFYAELFGWTFDTSGTVAPSVSAAGRYGFIEPAEDAPAAAGGVGGGPGYRPQVVFYVGVPDVAATLARAESLGATRAMGPEQPPGRDLSVAHFTDPQGNLIGIAGPASGGLRS